MVINRRRVVRERHIRSPGRITRLRRTGFRARVSQNASKLWHRTGRLAVVGDHDGPGLGPVARLEHVAALLVAAFGVFLCVLGHADHFGYRDGVEAAEGLEE